MVRLIGLTHFIRQTRLFVSLIVSFFVFVNEQRRPSMLPLFGRPLDTHIQTTLHSRKIRKACFTGDGKWFVW